ncbi:MAG TPA: HupE/UreJ family protein [Methylomirabilota bacterium]|nr:HupE/UreJ family protein [Methylomirabilota bacterium]
MSSPEPRVTAVPRSTVRVYWLATLGAVVLCAGTHVQAHDPGLSAIALRLTPQQLVVELTLARADVETIVWMDSNLDGRTTADEFDAARRKLEPVAAAALDLTVDGASQTLTNFDLELDASDAVHFRLAGPTPRGTNLTLRSELLNELPRGHRQYVSFRDASTNLLGEALLDVDNPTFSAPLPAPDRDVAAVRPGSFSRFIVLGVEHIGLGFDHLAFLGGLLIVGGTFRSVVKIVTAFTVAHSITLALVTFDLLRVSPRLVEPLIAVSIIYVGVENLIRRDLEGRWRLAFGFGLIHGCGFASVLRDMGIAGGADVIGPLVGFNVGVELGQIAIAALVLPLIWAVKDQPAFRTRMMPACSLLVALAGGFWLLQRMLPMLAG